MSYKKTSLIKNVLFEDNSIKKKVVKKALTSNWPSIKQNPRMGLFKLETNQRQLEKQSPRKERKTWAKWFTSNPFLSPTLCPLPLPLLDSLILHWLHKRNKKDGKNVGKNWLLLKGIAWTTYLAPSRKRNW